MSATPVLLHVTSKAANHRAAFQCTWARRQGQEGLLKLKSSISIGKKGDLSEFEGGMAGLSVSETPNLTQPFLDFTENGPKSRMYPVVRAEWLQRMEPQL